MTAKEAIELCGILQPRTVIPIHYEGWSHFREGREAIERQLANAPEDLQRRIRWLPIGAATKLDE
jgi:L-ascorbate metabolism protein UlaG (beta-lactamase superfamily)